MLLDFKAVTRILIRGFYIFLLLTHLKIHVLNHTHAYSALIENKTIHMCFIFYSFFKLSICAVHLSKLISLNKYLNSIEQEGKGWDENCKTEG